MNQPEIKHVSLTLTTVERDITLAFINAGFKSEINRVGLSTDASAVTNNALHLLKKFEEAQVVQRVAVLPPVPADITDPPASNS